MTIIQDMLHICIPLGWTIALPMKYSIAKLGQP